MPFLLIRKLENHVELTDEDRVRLVQLFSSPERLVEPREDIIRAGDTPGAIHVVLEGWAYRYLLLEDGRRQITGLLLPGDLCGLRSSLLPSYDHSVAAVGTVRVAPAAPSQMLELLARNARLDRALWWCSVVDEAIAHAWIANVGQRSASERIAHLFCEVFLRLQAVKLTTGTSCPFPLTQELLADATGLSAIHVNRSLMELRSLGLVTLRERVLTIPDFQALRSLAMFDPAYLHLCR